MNEEILTEITEQCERCPYSQSCPEEECVLFRIEQIVIEQKIIKEEE